MLISSYHVMLTGQQRHNTDNYNGNSSAQGRPGCRAPARHGDRLSSHSTDLKNMFDFRQHQHVWGLHWKGIDLSLVLRSTHLQALLNQALNHDFSFFKSPPYINRCEGSLGIHRWLNFFPLNNLVISSFRSNSKSAYIVFFHFPLLIIRSRRGTSDLPQEAAAEEGAAGSSAECAEGSASGRCGWSYLFC